MLIVITMIGIMAAIVVPRMRVSSKTRVRQAAVQLVKDIEQTRTRALTTRSRTRIAFVAGSNNYTGYLDINRDTVFAQSTAERDSLRTFRTRALAEGVVYGRSTATDIPTLPGAGNITFANTRVEFDTRGLTTPFGSSGVVYLTHPSDVTAIAAVTVTAGGSIRRWVFQGGTWR